MTNEKLIIARKIVCSEINFIPKGLFFCRTIAIAKPFSSEIEHSPSWKN